MERKFESELAEKVSLRSKSGFSGRKASVFVLAIISSAIMIGATAVTLSMSSSTAGCPWIEYTNLLDETDYLVYDLSEGTTYTDLIYADEIGAEDDFVVKRTSEVRTGEFDTPGDGTVYTKLVYSVNVKLRHTAPFEGLIAGLEVASLNVSGFGLIPELMTHTISLNGTVISVDGITVVTDCADGSITIDLVMPDLTDTEYAYESYDMVSFLVMLRVPLTGLILDAEEIGFPSYNPVTDEELVTL
ncbi:MAG: hypothetical protein KKE24_02425 [Candidatus Thermoplasmatota archaeon]|nr:hypothetical protein [Candidatus Thermoplasmatota archaeon]